MNVVLAPHFLHGLRITFHVLLQPLRAPRDKGLYAAVFGCKDLLGRPFKKDSPLIDHGHPIDHLENLGDLVGDDDPCKLEAFMAGVNQAQDRLPRERVKPGGRKA